MNEQNIMGLIGIFSIFLLIGFSIGYISNSLLLRFSQTLGIRNKNDVTIRWANESKPSLGGIGFFASFFFGTIAYAVLFNQENIFQNKQFDGLMLSALMAFVMGLADDAYNTKPMGKLVVQIACGFVLYYTNTCIELFDLSYLNLALTVLWVVGIMNSLNMLDNMDGITGTTSLFILLSCLTVNFVLYGLNMNIWTLTMLIQLGALISFLRFNIHPSKMFMGDAGSQFIGLFVSFFAIHELWSVGENLRLNPFTGALIALIAFTPTLVDTLTVMINRMKKGKSPMVGGKDHTTHHLVYKGYTDKQVWKLFLIIGFGSLFFTLLSVWFAKQGNPWYALLFSLYFFAIFGLLYRNTLKYKPKK